MLDFNEKADDTREAHATANEARFIAFFKQEYAFLLAFARSVPLRTYLMDFFFFCMMLFSFTSTTLALCT